MNALIMMNTSLVLLTGCWIFAIFEDHLLDIFRIRKLSLIFYFGTLLLKITNYIHLTTSLTVHT